MHLRTSGRTRGRSSEGRSLTLWPPRVRKRATVEAALAGNQGERASISEAIVVGGGPCGFACALSLAGLGGVGHVTLLEEKESGLGGGGAALNLSGGTLALKKIDEEAYNKLRRKGNSLNRVTARTSGNRHLFEADIGKAAKNEPSMDGCELITVLREDLCHVLEEACEEKECISVQRGTRVTEVYERGNKGEVQVEGKEEERKVRGDVVVRCTGIDNSLSSQDGHIRLIYGVGAPGNARFDGSDPSEAQQHFGDGTYTLRFSSGGDEATRRDIVAVAFRGSVAADEENAEWSQGDAARTKRRCLNILERNGFPNSVISNCDSLESFTEVGVRYHNNPARWSTQNGRVCLAGDAAHAMPPFLGQGANQALQDACALGMRIGGSSDALDALSRYEKARRPVTSAILQASRLVGLVETGPGVLGLARNAGLKTLGAFNVPQRIFISSAAPRL